MRNPSGNKTHYDAAYFSWQSNISEFGGWANLTKFKDYIKPTDTVLDFGCGGGYLLKNIQCKKRVGVEINPDAATISIGNGIEVYMQTNEVPDDYADIVISNNALEHTLQPLCELQTLYRKLKNGGIIVLVVPCESINYAYKPNDINHHLYSWSPMCFGNLITEAGFSLIESKPYIHKWPPKYRKVAKYGGRTIFEAVCRLYGKVERSWFQVRAIAKKI